MMLPIWQLRTALEEPSTSSCQLWVTTEWLIHCSDILYQEMTSNDMIDEATAKALQPGGLCPGDYKPLSLERWRFWKLKLEEETKQGREGQRCSEAIEQIIIAERQ